ncbi:MAG TPA: cytochrome c biogenesis protein CcsA [Coriobacteriia bacterium]|nr:cytochrome c biogenesis protein CcsA [Coriobacteriia bacterium]
MLEVAFVAFWMAMAFYVAATVLYAYHVATKRQALSWYATFATGAGFLLQTASIGLRSSATEGTELTGANVLVLMAWALVLVYFILEHVIKRKVYGALLVPLALLLMLIAQLMGLSSSVLKELTPEVAALLDSWRVGIHVALIAFANAGFVISAVGSLLYLAAERQLKSRKASKLLSRLPSLEQTDRVARRSIVWAFPAYSAGMLLGSLRAIETDVALWWADPRVILSALVWLAFASYQLLRWRFGWGGRPAAYLSVVGFVLVAILAVVARTVPAGFHIFGL